MSSYIGRHAQLYDIFYAEKNYAQEANFIHHLITARHLKSSKKLLEIACGTGSHAFQLEELGYKIEAIDYSESMIDRAKEKAKEKKSGIHFQVGDMRDLPPFPHRFDVAICLFDSIGYVIDNEAILQVLHGVNKNLKDKGIFIFEFWHAPAMLKSFDPVRVKRWKLEDREILRISETSVNILNSTSSVNYTIYEHFDDGTYAQLQEKQQNRFFQVQEMVSFIHHAGFKLLGWYGGYQEESTKIDDQTWHVVMVVGK